jgi:ATP-dependent helicase HrpB
VTDLPIHAVLPDLLAALRAQSAVLIAPPGAGKTTSVAPALLGEPWCKGTVILLSPRRVAARAAAERMAELLGEQPGETVGYLTRLDSRRSARTRILVMTEAIFVATILGDPDLKGFPPCCSTKRTSAISTAIWGWRWRSIAGGVAGRPAPDRHVRHDRRRALCRPAGQCARDRKRRKAFPLAIRWLGARPDLRLEQAMASAIGEAWRSEQGISWPSCPACATSSAPPICWPIACRGAGAAAPRAGGAGGQRTAIRRDAGGRRRIVLATAIAETSLTLDGFRWWSMPAFRAGPSSTRPPVSRGWSLTVPARPPRRSVRAARRGRGRAWPIACGKKPPTPGGRPSTRRKSSLPIWRRWR